jgi:hypothetical protein
VVVSYVYVFFAIQQKSLFNPRMSNNIPIMVRAMLAHAGFHQAKTITKAARTTRQRQNDMIPPLLNVYYINILSICLIMSSEEMVKCRQIHGRSSVPPTSFILFIVMVTITHMTGFPDPLIKPDDRQTAE